MAERYFRKFPTITYQNTVCTDITRRVRLDPKFKDNIELYYPTEIDSGFRADQLAEAYYDDAEMDWMVYLVNDIVDPYYEWHYSSINFEDFLITKYGDVANTQERIVYYRNNWYEDSNEITPQAYNEQIDYAWRKYYEPVFTPTNSIYAYRRKREDWTVNTNRIIRYVITGNTVPFTDDEIVDIKDGAEIVGGGTVINSNTTTVTIQHVSGNTVANTTWTKSIVGETSLANAATSNGTVITENFTTSESVFWSPVTIFDQELEKWEARKNIQVVDNAYALSISDRITEALNE
jgi:hypothetical protein